MNKIFDKLNLRPQERRLVVLIFFVVFVVLQIWFVRPYFSEWGRVQNEIEKSRATLLLQRTEVGRVGGPAGLQARLQKLEGEGSAIGPSMTALELQSRILNQAVQSAVNQNGIRSRSGVAKPGDFYEEQSFNVGFVNTGEAELIDFLYSMGAGGSLVRVRDLSVSPDAGNFKLSGQVTLTASLPRKAAPAPAAATTPVTGGAVAKPSVPVSRPGPLGTKK